jgi:hypothetical protein
MGKYGNIFVSEITTHTYQQQNGHEGQSVCKTARANIWPYKDIT